MPNIDLLGPASAPGAVTQRPAESRTFGATDTWMKPCTNAGTRDGTQLEAVFFNAQLAQLRAVIRAANIPIDNADDAMLLKAIRALIRAELVAPGSAALLNPGRMILFAKRDANDPSVAMDDTFRTWAFNSTHKNSIAGASLDPATGLITLPKGRYNLDAEGNAHEAGAHQLQAIKIATGEVIAIGLTGDSNTTISAGSNSCTTGSRARGWFELTDTTVIAVQHKNWFSGGASPTFGDDTGVPRWDAVLYLEREVGA